MTFDTDTFSYDAGGFSDYLSNQKMTVSQSKNGSKEVFFATQAVNSRIDISKKKTRAIGRLVPPTLSSNVFSQSRLASNQR